MEICLEKCIHEKTVSRVVSALPDEEVIRNLAETYKAIGDPSRLKIVMALIDEELCVCDLSAICNISESAVSHQLRALRNLRIVKNRRDGKIVFYRLDDDHVRTLLENSLAHAREHG